MVRRAPVRFGPILCHEREVVITSHWMSIVGTRCVNETGVGESRERMICFTSGPAMKHVWWSYVNLCKPSWRACFGHQLLRVLREKQAFLLSAPRSPRSIHGHWSGEVILSSGQRVPGCPDKVQLGTL